jgi:Ca-activated chloride channel homolog
VKGVLCILAGVALAAQDAPVRDSRVFRSAVELTSVTATVRDADGRLVTGLTREAFEVYEDGERQQVTHFTNERVPVSLALLLDISDSMFGRRLVDRTH